jgi:hypothetical protein
VTVVLVITAFGVSSVAVRAADLTVAWGLLPGMPGAGLPYFLAVVAALAASGGGRTSTVAVLGGLLLVVNLSLVWRPAAYLTIFAVACALALAPTARGIEWLTAPRRPIPVFPGPSVPERADAHDRARA